MRERSFVKSYIFLCAPLEPLLMNSERDLINWVRKLKRAPRVSVRMGVGIRVKRSGEQICDEALVPGNPVFSPITPMPKRARCAYHETAGFQLTRPVPTPAGKVGCGADLPSFYRTE
jgi:hypothetical protein